MREHLIELADCARRVTDAASEEELAEALSDMERIGERSVSLAIAVQLLKIQLERPVVLPLAVLMCGFSLYFAAQRWVS
ncbi:MAG: hypothetical protein HYX47_13305 [Burkholderiales bacterium]|nr:hypothetical protein [Burkholderiales bacterium]